MKEILFLVIMYKESFLIAKSIIKSSASNSIVSLETVHHFAENSVGRIVMHELLRHGHIAGP